MSRKLPDRFTKHNLAAHVLAGGLGVSAAKQGCILCDELEYAAYEWACPHCGAELIAPWQPCPHCLVVDD